MKPLRRFIKRLSSSATTQRDEERLQSEIEEHLALQTAENIRCGLSPTEARRQAALKFGPIQAAKESYRDGRSLPFLETLLQDTRYALRSFRKAPTFALTIVLTLALGIGATTSIFTLVYAVLEKSLAVADPQSLYRLGKQSHCCDWGGYVQTPEFSIVSYDLYRYFRDHTKGFAELAAFQAAQSLFGVRRANTAGSAHGYLGEFVSGNYFQMFGVRALAGRTITAQDDTLNAPPVAVMSYRLWQQKYGFDPSVIGSAFNVNEKSFIVVGIAPSSFYGDSLRESPPDFFLPLSTEPLALGENSLLHAPAEHWLDLIGRIRPGATAAALQVQMRVELKQWLLLHWGEMSKFERANFPTQTLFLSSGGAGITSMRAHYEHWLQILMMVSGFVLLIVCANVASLMLVRGMQQRQQMSLSMALGARAFGLVRQALTESILLSLSGGAAGLAVAFAGTRLILHFTFPKVNGLASVPIDASPSIAVLLFAFGVSLLTGLLFGIAPAWMATRASPIEALRGASRSTARVGSLPQKALVVLQAALCLVLLSVSGLLTVTLHNLVDQDFGFDQNRRTIVNIHPQLAGYRTVQLTPLYRRLHDALLGIPGVTSAALCEYSPLSGDNRNDNILVDGHPAPRPKELPLSSWTRVTSGFFDAIGIPILRGRGITEQDTATSRHVAVINEAFARKFFKNEDPIGKHFGRDEVGASRLYEVIGITKDARYTMQDLDKPIGPFFFAPQSQYDVFPTTANTQADASSHFLHDIIIVTKPGVASSSEQIRHALAQVDPNLPVISIHTLKKQVASQFNQQRLIARLSSFFGLLSLALASIGLYGVTAYNASRRTNEVGIRMALGASRGKVIALILRGTFTLIVLGLAIGIPLTFAAGRFLGAQLYGMNPYNATVILIAVAALAISAFIASLVPALRASYISPIEALRTE